MPTHAVNYLKYGDNIVIMEKGKIVASGSYEEIRKAKQFEKIIEIEE